MLKKFFIINLIFLFIFLLLNLGVFLFVSRSLDQEFVGEFEIFDLEDAQFDYVNVGTSHGSVSFDWKGSNINGLNLGKSGQPLIEDLFLLNQHNRYFDEDFLTIIPISFHTLCMDQNLTAKTQSLYVDEFKLLGMVRTDRIMEFIFDKKDGEYPADEFNLERFTPNIIQPSSCSDDIQNQALEIIDEIIEKYPNSILVTTPYYPESLSSIENFENFYSQMNRIINEHSINYFDYSRDERFNNTEYFYNNTHLNSTGREMFTELLFEEVLKSID